MSAHRAASSFVPAMSETERQALAAGTVWIEEALFTGLADLNRLLALPYPGLSAAERAFLDGPVEEVCRLVDPWTLAQEGALRPEVWDCLRAHGFFGLAIPREWGGLGFSALGQSAVYGKLASRALALSVVVLIPNSVGPGELLVAYGTPAQRTRWLPRLARGEEIPCFALTEPEAGSDAAAISARGVVFRGGDGTPWLRLDFAKRYITLAPVATLVGLAFKLSDPEDLLGLPPGRRDADGAVGITVALVPAATPGVEIGRRHDPLGLPFPNGPIEGRGVELPAEAILGGAEGAGRGWKMLVEALSGGRAISLPAQSAAGAKRTARVVGAWAAVRRQFGRPIAAFEGVGEKLAAIAGTAYALEAARVLLCGAVDGGERPAVAGAALKVAATEGARRTIADGMDVVAGAALCRGPANLFGDAHAGAAIGITVEGANVLTRGLIVFGQGVARSHPEARMLVAAGGDPWALTGAAISLGFAASGRALRAIRVDLMRGRLAGGGGGPMRVPRRRLAWAAARFAALADLALVGHGPRLKAREALAGRFADALAAWLLGLAVVRRFEAEGRRPEDLPIATFAVERALADFQSATEGIAANYAAPMLPGLGPLVRVVTARWLRWNRLGAPPSDRLAFAAARVLTTQGPARDRLTAGLYLSSDPNDPTDPLARLERAWSLAEAAHATGDPALAAEAEAARRAALAVDSFTPEVLAGRIADRAWADRSAPAT